jgi:spermidine synthase
VYKTLLEKLRCWWPLFLISSLSLFVELAAIRWISAEIRLLAYFKNLALLAAFLGLAIGFALVGKGRDYRFVFAPMWGLFVALVLTVGWISAERPLVYPGGGDEFLWYSVSASFWVSLVIFLGIVSVFFFSLMLLFIPLGQATGEEMALHPPVPAYIVNILASLFGVWAFSLTSFWQTPPVVWFGLALVGIGGYYGLKKRLSWFTLGIFAATLIGIAVYGWGVVWSPYNRLTLSEISYTRQNDGEIVRLGYILDVQHFFYQRALDLSKPFLSQISEESPDTGKSLQEVAYGYELPYKLASPGSRALIVGSGMGNDVAAALRSQVSHVDAVEIDPEILNLGRELHPEKPYDDPRVATITDDARSFFNHTRDQYDVVAFGLLDSHTLLSGLSSVRLDSFVYTVDSFRQVKEHLADHGYVAVTFAANPWIEERLGRMMAEAFGSERVMIYRSAMGVTFVAGDVTADQLAKTRLARWNPDPAYEGLPLPTDDWPYIYLRDRRIPAGYWQALLIIGLVCFALIARSFPEALRPDWHFWLLGAGFLLIEFKSITELALLFGSTWFVNSLAISGVLLMVLFANVFVLRRPRVEIRVVYGLLFASLALSYFFPLNLLAGLPMVAKAVISTALLSLPLLFSGVVFSESLRRAGEISRPIASNFSGSAVGGILEYGSIWWGIRSLYGMAAVIYLGALIVVLLRRRS